MGTYSKGTLLKDWKNTMQYYEKASVEKSMSYNARLHLLNTLHLHKRRTLLDLCYLYKLFHMQIKNVTLSSLAIQRTQGLHHTLNIVPKLSSTAIINREYSRHITAIWNMLPDDVKSANTLSVFCHGAINWLRNSS